MELVSYIGNTFLYRLYESKREKVGEDQIRVTMFGVIKLNDLLHEAGEEDNYHLNLPITPIKNSLTTNYKYASRYPTEDLIFLRLNLTRLFFYISFALFL